MGSPTQDKTPSAATSGGGPSSPPAGDTIPRDAERALPPPPPPPARRLLGFVYLHAGYTPLNFAAYLLATFFTITFFVYLNSSSGFILTELLGIKDKIGDLVGSLAFYDELASVAMAPLWGAASDRIGRRAVYSLGFLFIAVALAVYSLVQNVYPQMLLARLLFAIGGAACSSMLSAVLADCAGKLRGRISGLVGLMSGLGALLGVFVFLPLPSRFEAANGTSLGRGVQYTYWITAALSAALALFLWFAMARRSQLHHAPLAAGVKHRFSTLLVQGITAARDPRLAVAYASGFAARGNTVIITIFLPLWINAFFIESGRCLPGIDPNDEAMVKASCREAFTRSSVLSGVIQTFALIGAPLWGLLTDRFGVIDRNADDDNNIDQEEVHIAPGSTCPMGPHPPHRRFQYPTLPVLATCIMASLGYFLLSTVSDPTANSGVLWVTTVLVGLGEIGTVITSVAMVAGAYVPHDIRGAVSGAYSMFGAIGILICTKIGGLLFDSGAKTAPFWLMGIIHAIVAGMAALALVADVKRGRRQST